VRQIRREIGSIDTGDRDSDIHLLQPNAMAKRQQSLGRWKPVDRRPTQRRPAQPARTFTPGQSSARKSWKAAGWNQCNSLSAPSPS